MSKLLDEVLPTALPRFGVVFLGREDFGPGEKADRELQIENVCGERGGKLSLK